jgi:hypothetical protein
MSLLVPFVNRLVLKSFESFFSGLKRILPNLKKRWLFGMGGFVSVPLFWFLKTKLFLLGDGYFKLEIVPFGVVHLTEPLDVIIHHQSYRLLTSLFPNADPSLSFTIPSVVCGGAFIFLILVLADLLGISLFMHNDLSGAREEWERALKLNPDQPNAKTGLEKLGGTKERRNVAETLPALSMWFDRLTTPSETEGSEGGIHPPATLFQQTNQHLHQGNEKEYDQDDGDPHEQSRLWPGEFIAADGAVAAASRHVHCTVRALPFPVSHQLGYLLLPEWNLPPDQFGPSEE